MDLTSTVNPEVALKVQEIVSDTTTPGEIIDSQGYESVDFSAIAGTLTNGVQTITMEDGDDSGLSDAAAVDPTFIIGSLPSFADTEDDAVKHFGYVGKKRYIRINNVSTGTTTSAFIAAIATLGHAKKQPTV